jgi:hypothetical protein
MAKQSLKLKQARARAARNSRSHPDKKIYLHAVSGPEEKYTMSGQSGENVICCYKNGSEIAV